MHLDIDIRPAVSVGVTTHSGLLSGATVMTLDGELPVETLVPGDRIITRDTGMAVLRDIRLSMVKTAPIRIKAGTLGHNRPGEDALVARDTKILIRDWRAEALYGEPQALVPAKRLVDGEFISEGDAEQMMMFELVFDSQHVIYASGMEIASGAL